MFGGCELPGHDGAAHRRGAGGVDISGGRDPAEWHSEQMMKLALRS